MTGSKLAPSFIRAGSPAGKAWAERAPAVKAMDDPAPLIYARPDALRVFRAYFPDQPPTADPYAVVATIRARLKGYRHPNLYCETFVGTDASRYAEYLYFWQTTSELLHHEGLKVCGPSFYTGNATPAAFDVFRSRHFLGWDAISLQCYWGTQGFTLDHALRYRTVHKPGDPPVLIVECGLDEVEGGLPGWKKMGWTPQQYATSLRLYDTLHLETDPYVLAAFPFVLGPTSDWAAFDLEEIAPLLPGGDLVPVTPVPQPPVAGSEIERWAADVWRRAAVPYNPAAAIARYWLAEAKAGRYLGKPEGPEHPSETGVPYQEFAGAVVHWDGTAGVCRRALPFG